MRRTPTKAIAASPRKLNPGKSENPRSHVSPANAFGKGRYHPPSHRVTAIDDTAIIAAYSPSMNSDQRNPLYSVWKPAVNSDSASGRSNGARLVSATIAMAKIPNAMKPSGKRSEERRVG